MRRWGPAQLYPSLEQVHLAEAHHLLARDAQASLAPQESPDEGGDQGHPYLRHDGVLRSSQEGVDPPVLLNGLQEQLDWPPLLVNRGDRWGRQVKGIRP